MKAAGNVGYYIAELHENTKEICSLKTLSTSTETLKTETETLVY